MLQNLWKTACFLSHGTWNFTRPAFERHQKLFATSSDDLQSASLLSGKVCIVTGANSGLGFESAKFLVQRGARVHLVCRSRERGNAALQQLLVVVPKPSETTDLVKLHIADLSQPQQLKKFVEDFTQSNNRLDVLINNGGFLPLERQSVDGVTPELDACFATNSLATYLLSVHLAPLMQRTAEQFKVLPRVINVSSGGMYLERLNNADIQSKQCVFDGNKIYAQTKRQQVIMAEQMTKMFPHIAFFSCHPGWAETPGVIASMPAFHKTYASIMRTPAQGADTMNWLAYTPNVGLHDSGDFYFDRQKVFKHFTWGGTETSADEDHEFMRQMAELDALYWK